MRKKLLLLVLVLLFSYGQYAFLFRGHTEPPVSTDVTNQDSAVHSLPALMKQLGKAKWMDTAFEGRASETDYGTYIIPGLNSTRTLVTKGNVPGICSSMTPQGMAVTEDYIMVSAYCHTKQHNSVIYMIDKKSHSFLKEIVLPGKPHVGGLAFDRDHQILWYSSNEKGMAQAISIRMEELLTYDYETILAPIHVDQICNLYGIVRDSFMTFYDGCLYVGCYDEKSNSSFARYPVDYQGRLRTEMNLWIGSAKKMAIPKDYSTISRRVQGMDFYQDKLLLSQSYGILPSNLVLYTQSDERLYINEKSARTYRLPNRLEQICVDGDDLYLLFESAAYAYRATSLTTVDRILKLSLPRIAFTP